MTAAEGSAYTEALAYLDDHVNLEATVTGRVAPTLDGIRAVMELMGDPQSTAPVIHLTGTNGKGSTARMITSLLVGRGLSVGTYTSPDLERVNERLAWNLEPVPDEAFADAVGAVARLEPLLDGPLTRFEILTAAAYRWFTDVAVDAAVVEVGMGGRWDATNVADASVAVVTNVSLDHAEVIGPTALDIAREKAGIVKPGSTLVLGRMDEGLAAVFRAAGAARVWEQGRDVAVVENQPAHGGRVVTVRTPATVYEDVYLPVHGAHQGDNAALALAAAEAFFDAPLPAELVAEVFAGLRLPGRMEVVGRRPLVLLDGAHNPAGARAAAATLAEEFGDGRSRLLVVGMLRDRDPGEVLDALDVGAARMVVACVAPSPRSRPAADVASAARARGVQAHEAATVAEAVALAVQEAEPDDLVLVTGSLYVVGAARAVLVAGSSGMEQRGAGR